MPLGMEVGVSPGDFLLDGSQPPPQKGAEPPNFRPTSTAAKRLHGSRCHLEVGLGSDNIVLDRDPAPLPKNGQSPLLNFQPMFIVTKWLDESR